MLRCSFHLAVNAPIRTWIRKVHRAKIVNQHHRYNGIIQTSIYLQSRANHHVTFECIMHVIVLMPDKGHYFAKTKQKNKKKTIKKYYTNAHIHLHINIIITTQNLKNQQQQNSYPGVSKLLIASLL